MKAYKNCPNCGGTLDDTGRCKYCGSKVYDFCDIDCKYEKYEWMTIIDWIADVHSELCERGD